MLVLILIFVVFVVFLYNAYKVVRYTKDTQIDHTYFKELEVNSIITDVAISRKTEIKILGINEWIRVGGCKLELSKNQNEPTDYFLKGDSIIKKKNSNIFHLIRKSEKYNWVIE